MIIYLLFPHFSFFSFPFICRFHPWVPLLLLLVFFDIWPLARERQDFFFSPALQSCVSLNLTLTLSDPDSTSTWQNLRLDLKWQRRPCLRWLIVREVVLPTSRRQCRGWQSRCHRVGFHLSFLMECGQVTHLSAPQSPQQGEKSGLKNNRASLKKVSDLGAGWGVGCCWLSCDTVCSSSPSHEAGQMPPVFRWASRSSGVLTKGVLGWSSRIKSRRGGTLSTLTGWTPLPTRSSPCTHFRDAGRWA